MGGKGSDNLRLVPMRVTGEQGALMAPDGPPSERWRGFPSGMRRQGLRREKKKDVCSRVSIVARLGVAGQVWGASGCLDGDLLLGDGREVAVWRDGSQWERHNRTVIEL